MNNSRDFKDPKDIRISGLEQALIKANKNICQSCEYTSSQFDSLDYQIELKDRQIKRLQIELDISKKETATLNAIMLGELE